MGELQRQTAAGQSECMHSELSYKQMQEGSFRWPPIMDGVMRLSSVEFAALFDGLDWSRVQETRRIHKPSAAA
jgi:transposase